MLKIHLFFSVLTVFLLLLGPFWWVAESSSLAAWIRGCIILTLVLSLLRSRFCFRIDLAPFIVVCCLMFIYFVANSILVSADSQGLRRILVIAAFVFSLSLVLEEREELWFKVLAVAVVVAAGFGLFSIAHKIYSGPFSFEHRRTPIFDSGVPGVADFGNTIVAGLHYAFFYIAAVWLFFRSNTKYAKVVFFACMLILGIYIYFTYARSSWVAALVGMTIIFTFYFDKKLLVRAIVALGSIGGAVILWRFYEFKYEFFVRGLTSRDEIWKVMLSRIAENWFFGHGAGSGIGGQMLINGKQVINNSHSLYLEIFYQFGVVGLVLVLVMLCFSIFNLTLKRSELSVFWLAITIAGALVMLAELRGFVGSPNAVWLWFWLPLAGSLAQLRLVRNKDFLRLKSL